MPDKKTLEKLHGRKAKLQKEKIICKIREEGCRITKQRLELLDIILKNECSSCKEIYYQAAKLDRKIGSATVYRMINILEEIGAISRKNMYKVADDGGRPAGESCVIALSDDSNLCLSPEKWNAVLQEGLRACGYLTDQKVCSLVIKPCDPVKKGG